MYKIILCCHMYLLKIPNQHECGGVSLLSTHFLQDKMTTILADNIFKCIYLNENI